MEKILSCRTIFYNIVIIASQSVWMSWPRHPSFHSVTDVHDCLEHGLSFHHQCHHHHHCWNAPPITSLCSHSLFGLHKCSASVDECQCVPFFLHRQFKWHTIVSYLLPCHMPCCQTAPLLPSVTWQQNVVEYWWEGLTSTAIPPILPVSTSDAVG